MTRVTVRRIALVALITLAALGLVFAVSASKPTSRIDLASADLPTVSASATATVCTSFAHYVDETGGWWIYATADSRVHKAYPSGWWVQTSPASTTYALIMEDSERHTVRWDAYGTPHTDAIAIGVTPETRCDF